ncbi:MAG: cytochrome c peroxidase [Xanthomonadales bacterium]|nr:cytochrome c peroxidase [Xanthomonadales bacterium]
MRPSNRRRYSPIVTLLLGALQFHLASPVMAQPVPGLSDVEQLGKSIFFDPRLSLNGNQSCAACHDPDWGWTGPDSNTNALGSVYEGSIAGRFGNRKPPSSAYATFSPIFHLDAAGPQAKNPSFVGGNFWDGRATGEKLGNPAADQAQGPFLNPVEQALPDSACVIYRICDPDDSYPVTLTEVAGPELCAIDWPADIETNCATEGGIVGLDPEDRSRVGEAYDTIALAIAMYEASPESNAFTSKFDYAQRSMVKLTAQERWGRNLFLGKAKCARCHTMNPRQGALFTDFTYDNLGLPRNPDNPWYDMLAFNPLGPDWIDLGLGGFLDSRIDYQHYAAESNGKHKVPTLRNVDRRPFPGSVKAFGHNGYFKTLKQIVHFYNTRDIKPICPDPFTPVEMAIMADCWPEPEVDVNINTEELGDLGLSEAEEDAIVAFMKTLSDGFNP